MIKFNFSWDLKDIPRLQQKSQRSVILLSYSINSELYQWKLTSMLSSGSDKNHSKIIHQ